MAQLKYRSITFLLIVLLCHVNSKKVDYSAIGSSYDRIKDVYIAVHGSIKGEPECKIFKDVLNSIVNGTISKDQDYFWIPKMIDSWSKFPSGIFEGNVFDRGHFDECLAIDSLFNGKSIKGKYCASAVTVPVLSVPVSLSLCIPEGCDIGNEIINGIKISNIMCQTKGSVNQLEWDDYSVLGVFAAILALIVISTIYDSILHYNKQKSPHPLFIAFSALTNGKKLFAVSNATNQVACLHGIRAISLMWIIAGHRFVSVSGLPNFNMVEALNFKNSINSAYISSARAAVDTFFLFSAFLVSYIYFKGVKSAIAKAEAKGSTYVKNPLGLAQLPMFYIHRILRITPALAATFFVQITLLRRINEGPFWPLFVDMMTTTCHKWWWSFFLYVQNYVNYKDMCIVPSWYLSADMQLYILCPILIIPLGTLIIKGKKRMGYIIMGVAIILSIIIPMIIDFYRDFDILNIYETHCRLSVYIIGLLFGLIVVDCTDKKIQINNAVNLALWALSLGVMIAIIVTMHDTEVNPEKLKNNLYFTFTRPIWSAAVCWIVFACHFGYGGPVNWLLSKSIFQIMTKLSFAMYLLHNLVITYSIGGSKTATHFSQFETMYEWCGDYIFTIAISIIWVLCFESPVVVLEKVIFARGTPKKTPANNENLPTNKTEGEIA